MLTLGILVCGYLAVILFGKQARRRGRGFSPVVTLIALAQVAAVLVEMLSTNLPTV